MTEMLSTLLAGISRRNSLSEKKTASPYYTTLQKRLVLHRWHQNHLIPQGYSSKEADGTMLGRGAVARGPSSVRKRRSCVTACRGQWLIRRSFPFSGGGEPIPVVIVDMFF